jgi:hypothetical protein
LAGFGIVSPISGSAKSDDDVGDPGFFLVDPVELFDQALDGWREGRQCGADLVEAVFDAAGDAQFAFAGQQLDGAHFAHVHAHRVCGASELAVDRGQRRRRPRPASSSVETALSVRVWSSVSGAVSCTEMPMSLIIRTMSSI